MLELGLNLALVFLSVVVVCSLVSRKSFSLGRWYRRDENTFKYWESIIAYIIVAVALWFARQELISIL